MARRRTSTNLSEFGKRVEAWRKKHGLSQAVVADLIGTRQRTYSGWLSEDGMPGAVYQIARLAELMGESVGDLVKGDVSIAPVVDRDRVRGILARTIPQTAAHRYAGNLAGRVRQAGDGGDA